ncbi:MAG: 7-cyano-7-deazaguanine synthase QueC [Thermodesulfovibrionales bacterium]|nr:7-cyano-7-deazaguanine synthase QueC [Thermodesulfovibrionales bacterium]
MKNAVVLLSGGVDSTTSAYIAKSSGYGIYALSFDYKQRHRIEIECAKKIARQLEAKQHLIISFDMSSIGGSALTSDIEVPKNRPNKTGEIPVTYVPARNTIFLSFALAWAEVLSIEDIFIGANAIDYSGYPDCRPQYLEAFESMANLATKVAVEGKLRFRINAPLLKLKKSEIIKKGNELGVDFASTWSCYNPISKDGIIYACGVCDSCLFRIEAFKSNDIEDPIRYL